MRNNKQTLNSFAASSVKFTCWISYVNNNLNKMHLLIKKQWKNEKKKTVENAYRYKMCQRKILLRAYSPWQHSTIAKTVLFIIFEFMTQKIFWHRKSTKVLIMKTVWGTYISMCFYLYRQFNYIYKF